MTRHWLIFLILLLPLLALADMIPVPEAETQELASVELTPWQSEEGITRLERSGSKADLFRLANHFEAQHYSMFCGPATAAIVLNALRHGKEGYYTPQDAFRMQQAQTITDHDITLHRFTQSNIFNAEGAKSRAVVMGQLTIDESGNTISDVGFQLRQLAELLRAHGALVTMRSVSSDMTQKEIKTEIVHNLRTPGDYVIINYDRKLLGQEGGGHISPLAAYDAESDSFLIMDVNPARASWTWAPAIDLISAMNTLDTRENRGYLLVQEGLQAVH